MSDAELALDQVHVDEWSFEEQVDQFEAVPAKRASSDPISVTLTERNDRLHSLDRFGRRASVARVGQFSLGRGELAAERRPPRTCVTAHRSRDVDFGYLGPIELELPMIVSPFVTPDENVTRF